LRIALETKRYQLKTIMKIGKPQQSSIKNYNHLSIKSSRSI
jgi:hypothetical protein